MSSDSEDCTAVGKLFHTRAAVKLGCISRECLQADTEDAPVLDRPAPLRRLRDSGAGYKYPDLLTY